jgi:CHAD domain-containing protein
MIKIESLENYYKKLTDKFILEFEKTKKEITADNLHDLRVSIRRLSSMISLIKMLPNIKIKKSILKNLNLLMKPLGLLRDILLEIDILNSIFEKQNSFVQHLVENLKIDAEKLENKIKNRMNKFPMGFLSEINISKILEQAIDINIDYEFNLIIANIFKEFCSYKKEAENKDIKSFHHMRIILKKLRYTSEILKDIFPWLTQEKLDDMHSLQQIMGEIHDIDVLLDKVQKFKKQKNRGVQFKYSDLKNTYNKLNEKKSLLFEEFKKNTEKVFSYEKDFISASGIGDEQSLQKEFVFLLNDIEGNKQKTLVHEALDYAKSIYVLHPLRTAIIIAEEMKIKDIKIIISALLHDTLESKGSSATKEKIENKFGKDIADIVWNLTKEENENSYEKYLNKIKNADEETRILKLADRLDSTRFIKSKSLKKQRAYWKSNFEDIFPICRNINALYWNFFYLEFKKIWDKSPSVVKEGLSFPKK